MNWLFAPPSTDDLIRLLKAWRFWVLGALVGALIGAAVYFIAPPPYRARATVLVDFNLEQAWPQETDRQQFYYLERETRKLEEIAWSDTVMQAVAAQAGQATVGELRAGKLLLSQPGEAGWHFYADDRDAERAATLASAWAEAFTAQVSAGAQAETVNPYVQATLTQAADLPVERRASLSAYLLTGAVSLLFFSAFCILFFAFGQPRNPR